MAHYDPNFSVWPISDMAGRLIEVRSVGRSGLDLLTLSSSHFDPSETLACRRDALPPTIRLTGELSLPSCRRGTTVDEHRPTYDWRLWPDRECTEERSA